jgi:hypothetical protein
MNKPIVNNPNASVLINSMRSIGYEFDHAIADILDNSITAGCSKIDIIYPINEKDKPFLMIFDDGKGMDRKELQEAMRFGSVKDTQRDANDLGRFGLGLKTASLSQCRKFSCISKKDGQLNGFFWDIDLIQNGEWLMYEISEAQIKQIAEIDKYLNYPHFTLVFWEKFDVFEKEKKPSQTIHDVFFSNLKKTKTHLSLVFHRYIEENLKICFNDDLLVPKDPFLKDHKRTVLKEKQLISTKTKEGISEKIEFQVFILPFHKDLNPSDYELIGGIEQIENQGFYVYRNKRLMNFGSWFRLKPKNTLYENARILVDIPNTLDDLWSIDIKKQKAIIPASLLEQLSREVDDVVVQSKKIHTYKGEKQTQVGSIWNKNVNHRDNQVTYLINLESQPLKMILESIKDDKTYEKIVKLIELIQYSIPYRDIYTAVAEKKDINHINEEQVNKIVEQGLIMFKESMKNKKTTKEKFIETISNYEPFSNEIVISLLLEKIKEYK